MLIVGSPPSVEMRYADTPPVIDGRIEEAWQTADSAFGFFQLEPYEKVPASERTVVYLLQDNNNFYAAFRCWTTKVKPVVSLSAYEDRVVLYLDPFGSRTSAYYFRVTPTGCLQDGWILDDGRTTDDSWDGVWLSAVRVYDDRYEVELKIPFKSFRYKKDLSEWGINFRRYCARIQENDYWTEYTQREGLLVSKFGVVRSVQPRSAGYYFELYPEGFVRADRIGAEPVKVKPSGSFNLKWDLTPQVTLTATAFPDFAQIESDPYAVNLSRYETRLSERRPFFLEGKDIFRMSKFGNDESDFYSPLSIFYSRRIGKPVGNSSVPILGGLKVTAKTETWNLGGFGAYTDDVQEMLNDTLPVPVEPHRAFAVVRARRRLLPAFDLGLLASGTAADPNDYNYALGLDGVYLSGANQLIAQAAVSDKNRKTGWAFSAGYAGYAGNFLAKAAVEVIGDSFDVADVGYVPWAGRKTLKAITGPFTVYPRGGVRSLFFGPGAAFVQEPGSANWSKTGFGSLNLNFRSNWGFNLDFGAGDYYEADTHFLSRNASLMFWASNPNWNVNFGGTAWYGYNWLRGFLAYQGSQWLSMKFTISPLNLSLDANLWTEWDTVNSILAMTPTATPRVDVMITNAMSIGVFDQLVFALPRADLARGDLAANRFGLLFSWNFRPKSWFYIAATDFREQTAGGRLALRNQVGAVKVKYLVYF